MSKHRSRFDELGDLMKSIEMIEAGRRLMPGLPVMARLDGRSFHTFTRGLPRPYHEPLSRAMIETAKYLVEETHASFAYTQSDEITLGYWTEGIESKMMFDGRVQKLTSVLAAMATAKFNQQVALNMPEKAHLLPVFDARVFNMPNLDEMANCVLFRALDCAKNSITMAASAYYSHKELHGKGSAAKHEMLYAKGVNWAHYPAFFKDGTFLRREVVLKELSEQELSRIPEKHRPSGPVQRSVVQEVETPPFAKLANQKGFLFYGEAPVLRTTDTAEVD